MELQHINVKLYLENSPPVKLEALVPVFHEWIQDKVCEELLIDVADYTHLYAGPGVVLVGHEADYSVDNTGNRPGIRYNRKAVWPGSNRDRFSQALRAALQACRRLESEEKLGGTVRFDRQGIKLSVNDRMLAPNSGRPTDAEQAEFRDFFSSAFGDSEFEMKFESDPRSLFGVEVRAVKALDLDGVLARLAQYPVKVQHM
jgi:hypothetical protein